MFKLICIFFAAAVSVQICAAEPAEPIAIGTVLILSGEGSSWGIAAKNGVDLAVSRLNEAGGVAGRPLKAVHQDDQGDAKNTVSAFKQLTEIQGIRFIIGPNWSTLGLPLVDAADRAKVIVISPTLGSPKFNEASPFLFNTWPHDYVLSEKLAQYVYGKGHRAVALVGAEDVWVKEQSEAFAAKFKELGGSVVYKTEPLPGTRDLKTEALLIKSRRADAMISTTDGIIVGSLAAKALRDIGSKIPFFSITLDQAAIDAADGGFEGLEFLTFLTPKPRFKADYEAKFKTAIDIGADSAYDAVMMLAQAIDQAKTVDTAAVAEKLAAITEFKGVSGSLVSDGKRGFQKKESVKVVRQGRAADLEN